MKIRKVCSILILTLVLALCSAVPVMAASTGSVTSQTSAVKAGVIKVGKKWHYAENGKAAAAPNTWKTINGKTYYFNAKSYALTGVAQVNNVYYLFSAWGVLQKASSGKAVATVNGRKYMVDTKGRVYKNTWNGKKTMYFGNTYAAVRGTQVIDGKFYYFTKKTAVKSASITAKLQKASRYEKSNFSALKKLIGNPKKSSYYGSCFGTGRDGIQTYNNFIVYTYKEGSKEIVMTVESSETAPTYVPFEY